MQSYQSYQSAVIQLIEYTSDVLKTVQDKKQSDTVVMDFSKAFEKVSHDLLIYKLDRAGRPQKVIIDGEESKSVPVTSGVPQVSHCFCYR